MAEAVVGQGVASGGPGIKVVAVFENSEVEISGKVVDVDLAGDTLVVVVVVGDDILGGDLMVGDGGREGTEIKEEVKLEEEDEEENP